MMGMLLLLERGSCSSKLFLSPAHVPVLPGQTRSGRPLGLGVGIVINQCSQGLGDNNY
jgi:hypothetical protein